MSSNTYSPSIDQGAKLNFIDSFYELAQQTKSKLVATGAIKWLPSSGKTNNMARIGRLELAEVATRNPDKQYGDYALDNRQFTKKRFTRTVTIDAKYDINELLKDPTSDILMQLDHAKERVIDRIAIAAAVGAVLVGQPDAAPTSISAATDGVLTIDATAGIAYSHVTKVTQNYINNDLDMGTALRSTFCLTGKENTALMSEDKFINTRYVSAQPVEEGVMKKAGAYPVVLFAGSETGGLQVQSPILPEGSTTRTCVVLAPEAIAMAMEIGDVGVEKSATKVNSYDITIDLWINAMRTEGPKVQLITTTM